MQAGWSNNDLKMLGGWKAAQQGSTNGGFVEGGHVTCGIELEFDNPAVN